MKNKNSMSEGQLPSVKVGEEYRNPNIDIGGTGPRLEPMEWRDKKKAKKKRRRRKPRFSDQIGVKVSWSTWQWRQGQEEFHNNTLKRATSYVGRQIREHQDRLEKLNSIFDPQKMKELQKVFQQKKMARDNLGMLKRLSMIATEKTAITKTNDPVERRYVNKFRRDKARMIRNSKQYDMDMINFDNKLMLKRLRKTRTSLQSRRGLKRDFKRSRVMKKAMAKVFDPKYQRQMLQERGLYNPVYAQEKGKQKKRRPRRNRGPINTEAIRQKFPGIQENPSGYDHPTYLNEGEEFHYDMASTPGADSLPPLGATTPPYTPGLSINGDTGFPVPYSSDTRGSGGLGRPPLARTPNSRSSASTAPLVAPMSAASSVFSTGAFVESQNLLMKQTGMRIADTGVLVSAYRGPKEALVYEIADPKTGIVTYFDIPSEVIYDIGNEFPALLETAQGSRIEKLATLLDMKNYFNGPSNISAKMYWWHKQQDHS